MDKPLTLQLVDRKELLEAPTILIILSETERVQSSDVVLGWVVCMDKFNFRFDLIRDIQLQVLFDALTEKVD